LNTLHKLFSILGNDTPSMPIGCMQLLAEKGLIRLVRLNLETVLVSPFSC